MAAEIGEDGEDPAVAAVLDRQAEFEEDVADVLVDGVACDEEPSRDGRVVVALGHQRQDLAFTCGQGVDGITVCEELGDDLGVHSGAAVRHAAQRFGEFHDAAHAVLEQVSDAAPGIGEEAGRVLLLHVLGQDQDLQGLLGGELLPEAMLAEMQDTVPVGEEMEVFWPDAGYGLGLMNRPLSCGGSYWSHEGGESGYITLNGATDDGGRAVTVSMSTALGDSPDNVLRQEQAASALVDHALCGTSAGEWEQAGVD